MKFSTVLAGAGLAAAAPTVETANEKRQLGGCTTGFVWARGSTEPAPLGILIGPKLERALKRKVPGLKTYPVLYAASLTTNISLDRTDPVSKGIGERAFEKAAGECQQIVAGGYSQGAAVMHNVLGTVNRDRSSLSASVKEKVMGVALFGSTRNKQDGGHIRDFPTERSKTWCNVTDGVCGGLLLVNAGHLAYSSRDINEAADYLAGTLSGGASSSSSGGGLLAGLRGGN